MLFNHLGSRKIRGCNCNLTGWGRQWKKGLKSDLPSTWQVGLRLQASTACCSACRSWQGIRNYPCSKKKLLLVKPLTPKRPFSPGKGKAKNKIKKNKIKNPFLFFLQQRFISKKSRRDDGKVLIGISHPHPQVRADLEASVPSCASLGSAASPSASTGCRVQLSHWAVRADGWDETNRHQVSSFVNGVKFWRSDIARISRSWVPCVPLCRPLNSIAVNFTGDFRSHPLLGSRQCQQADTLGTQMGSLERWREL